MTTLTKLGVQGIRSFSSERMESLEFERPVTLIVGHNGAGKTTIIESLKMYEYYMHELDSDVGRRAASFRRIATKVMVLCMTRTLLVCRKLRVRSVYCFGQG